MIGFIEVYNTIVESLKTNTPIAITRYGDGEGMALNLSDKVYEIQYGRKPDLEIKKIIGGYIVWAYMQSDIIGIPTEKHDSGSWVGSLDNLKKYIKVIDKLITSVDFAHEMLQDGLWDNLLRETETLCYISCRNLDDQFKSLGIKNVYSYQIAPEMQLNPDYNGKPHYPDQFYEIKEWIKTLPLSALCLTGAGVTGKIYNIWFKEAGGIAVDVGSVFDYWAGFKTRGKGKGVNVKYEKYKL